MKNIHGAVLVVDYSTLVDRFTALNNTFQIIIWIPPRSSTNMVPRTGGSVLGLGSQPRCFQRGLVNTRLGQLLQLIMR